MIVFGTHCNFFIVLPIRLKTCTFNGFLGASQRFCASEHARSASGEQIIQVCIKNDLHLLHTITNDQKVILQLKRQ